MTLNKKITKKILLLILLLLCIFFNIKKTSATEQNGSYCPASAVSITLKTETLISFTFYSTYNNISEYSLATDYWFSETNTPAITMEINGQTHSEAGSTGNVQKTFDFYPEVAGIGSNNKFNVKIYRTDGRQFNSTNDYYAGCTPYYFVHGTLISNMPTSGDGMIKYEDSIEDPIISSSTENKILAAPNIICITNELCYINLSGTINEENWFIELHAYGDGNWGENILATTTIENGDGRILVPNSTIATKTPYTIISMDNNVLPQEIEISNATVIWLTNFPGNMYSTSTLSHVCDDIATSTGTRYDDLRYGLECGTRKAIYWAFVPNKVIFDDLNYTYTKFQNAFPFSVPFEVFNLVKNSASSTLSDNIDINATVKLGNSTSSIKIFGTSLIDDLVGSSTRKTLRDTGGYFIYLITILGIGYQLLRSKI